MFATGFDSSLLFVRFLTLGHSFGQKNFLSPLDSGHGDCGGGGGGGHEVTGHGSGGHGCASTHWLCLHAQLNLFPKPV